jgi:hypothetical protein
VDAYRYYQPEPESFIQRHARRRVESLLTEYLAGDVSLAAATTAVRAYVDAWREHPKAGGFGWKLEQGSGDLIRYPVGRDRQRVRKTPQEARQ